MKTYFKSVFRSIKNNVAKFVSLSAIIFLGIAMSAGLCTLSDNVEASVNQSFDENNAADLIVKSKSVSGFTAEELTALSAVDGVRQTQALTSVDFLMDEEDAMPVKARLVILPADGLELGKLAILEGEMPQVGTVAVERASDEIAPRTVGEKLSIFGTPMSVSGIVGNPVIFSRFGEPNNDLEMLGLIAYTVQSPMLPFPMTDLYLRLNLDDRDIFSAAYRDAVGVVKQRVEELGDYAVLTLEENTSKVMLATYSEKIDVITLIFPIFFVAVAALVVLTGMTRMVEEERGSIGCMASLGYGNGAISLKYIIIGSLFCLLSSVVGFFLGLYLLPKVIYPAFDAVMFLPAQSTAFNVLPGLIAIAAMLIAVVAVTSYVVNRDLRGSPSGLFVAKAPKVGKKIFLEKVDFLWKRLSFKRKSTLRNIFRFKSRLAMTVISVAGSTALIFAGLALRDAATDGALAAIAGALQPVSLVVIIFAIALSVFVIYNLTNMNIGERKREIATLKVLGYSQREVTGYIYREVSFMATLGVVFGIPLGVLLVWAVFKSLEIGSLSSVMWFSYLITAALVAVFVALVDLILQRKIKSVDMTTSLKSVE